MWRLEANSKLVHRVSQICVSQICVSQICVPRICALGLGVFASVVLLVRPCLGQAGDSAAAAAENQRDLEAVQAADLGFADALARRDKEVFLSFFERGGTFLGATVSRGRNAIYQQWEPFFDPARGMTLIWRPTETGVAASGELAYSMGDAVMSFRRGAVTQSRPGRYLSIWRKNEAGAWKIFADGTLVIYPDASEVRDLRRGLGGFWPPFRSLDAHVKLEWKPESKIEARSGDMAVTLGGYFAWVEHGEPTQTTAGHGGYLTLWKRAKDPGDGEERWVVRAEAFSPPRPNTLEEPAVSPPK